MFFFCIKAERWNQNHFRTIPKSFGFNHFFFFENLYPPHFKIRAKQ